MALLKSYAETDPLLHKHLYQPHARSITYLSSWSQNEIINIIGCDMIQAEIIKEIKNARYYFILADEVTSHNQEYLPYVFALWMKIVIFESFC